MRVFAPPVRPLVSCRACRFRWREIGLEVGDTLIAWTDGVTEAQDPEGFYGEERHGLLCAHASVGPPHLLAKIASAVARHGGGLEPSARARASANHGLPIDG